jgi:hypothetical protein
MIVSAEGYLLSDWLIVADNVQKNEVFPADY